MLQNSPIVDEKKYGKFSSIFSVPTSIEWLCGSGTDSYCLDGESQVWLRFDCCGEREFLSCPEVTWNQTEISHRVG